MSIPLPDAACRAVESVERRRRVHALLARRLGIVSLSTVESRSINFAVRQRCAA